MAQPNGVGRRRAGYTAALTATTEVAVRATTYTEQTSNAQRSIKSASANDAAAGTGARIVRLWYLPLAADGTVSPLKHEDITLNGTSAVATAGTDICLIENMEIISAGSGGKAAGAITLYDDNAGAGSAIWSIASGDRQTYGAHHYVPNGVSCQVQTALFSTTAPAVADYPLFLMRYKQFQVASGLAELEHVLLEGVNVGPNGLQLALPPGLVVPGPARIVAYTAPGSSTSQVNRASFTFFEQ